MGAIGFANPLNASSVCFSEGEVIYTPSVVDKDDGLNGKITYSIAQVTTTGRGSNPFVIDLSSGAVSLSGKKPLDFEIADEYVVVIKAEDSGFPKKYGKRV